MIRLKISNFIRKNKGKINVLGRKLIMVAVIIFIATIILSSLSDIGEDDANKDTINVYKPTETVVKGSDVSEEQYEEDKNLVNVFLDFCNNRQVEEAYNLISDECKEEIYPTIEVFKENYYDYVFDTKREYSLQSYINSGDYTIYRIRYLNNMLATGTYDENNIYQDYITLNKKDEKEKISIGKFVDSKKYEVITKTDEIEAKIQRKTIYLSYEEYEITIKNNTEKTILLNNLEDSATIRLIAGANARYNALTSKLFLMDLIIKSNQTKTVTIKFMKELSSSNKSKQIEILNIIKDYDLYMENKKEYKDTTTIKIKVEE